jgi:hypothetical protein
MFCLSQNIKWGTIRIQNRTAKYENRQSPLKSARCLIPTCLDAKKSTSQRHVIAYQLETSES